MSLLANDQTCYFEEADDTDEYVDPEQLIRGYAVILLSEATGGDASLLEQLPYSGEIEKDMVERLLQEAKIPNATILREDLERVFQGEEPRYFISSDRIVELYRSRHGVRLPPRDPKRLGIRHASEVLCDYADERAREFMESESYGASLAEYRRGVACAAEQTFFYGTQEWQDRAKVVRVMDRFACRECGRRMRDMKPEEKLHVHHDEHIYSAYSDTFYRNFDSLRLRALCKFCHDEFHVSHKRGFTHFVPAKELDREQDHRMRAAMAKVHDLLRECSFCFGAPA